MVFSLTGGDVAGSAGLVLVLRDCGIQYTADP